MRKTYPPTRHTSNTCLKFHARINTRGINPYVLVSAARAAKIRKSWRKPLPVLVRLNGLPARPWSINMMPVGNGGFYLYLHNTIRSASHTRVGDTVLLEIAFDRLYKNGPQHRLPRWFRNALTADPIASNSWRTLPPSRQKEVLRYFSLLKSDAAKARNLAKVMRALSGASTRFMARTWRHGR